MAGKLSLCWQKTGVAVSNFIGQMRANVLVGIQNMVNSAISLINGFINALNKIPGVSLQAISQVTFASTAQAQFNAEKTAREQGLADAEVHEDASRRARAWELLQMKGDLNSKMADLKGKYTEFKADAIAMKNGDGIDSLGPFDTGEGAGLADNAKKTAGNTAAAAGALAETKENLEYLRDIAEQEAINRFTTAEIKIDYSGMTNQISSNMDLDNVLDTLTVKFVEAVQMGAEGVHN